MNKNTIAYWICTALICLASTGGGIMDLMRAPDLVAIMTHLGYPLYLMTILGTWKILGVLALLAPGMPRLKEWAYAGFVFDLSGAALSHIAAGDPVTDAAPPLVLLGLTFASWALRPADRKLMG